MKKFLSLILALTLVASLFTVNVMAASKAHTMTLVADKTADVKAGDVITVTVALDNTADIQSLGYRLLFDADAFDIDRTKGWESEEDYEMRENFIDQAWYDSILTDVWGKRHTTFAYGYDDPAVGCITLGWTGNAVPATKVTDNFVLGKFYFTVKNDVADGTYEIKIDSENSSTTDTGENFGEAITANVITVKVGADAPAVVEPTFGATTDMGTDGVVVGDKKYDNALAVETKIAAGTNTTEIGVLFAPEAWLDGAALVADKAGVAKAAKTKNLGAGETTITAAIRNIPRIFEGKNIVMVTVPYAFDGTNYTYGAEVKTTVNFGNTGE